MGVLWKEHFHFVVSFSFSHFHIACLTGKCVWQKCYRLESRTKRSMTMMIFERASSRHASSFPTFAHRCWCEKSFALRSLSCMNLQCFEKINLLDFFLTKQLVRSNEKQIFHLDFYDFSLFLITDYDGEKETKRFLNKP